MNDTAELTTRLRETAPRIDHWRAQASQLHTLVAAARVSHAVSESLLLSIEETSGAIYAEIAEYNGMLAEIAVHSPAAAAELAGVGEALHLVLMEITELGTELYAVREA
jgi:hypothetical protein